LIAPRLSLHPCLPWLHPCLACFNMNRQFKYTAWPVPRLSRDISASMSTDVTSQRRRDEAGWPRRPRCVLRPLSLLAYIYLHLYKQINPEHALGKTLILSLFQFHRRRGPTSLDLAGVISPTCSAQTAQRLQRPRWPLICFVSLLITFLRD
jgi:hypothetical protein